MVSCEKNTWNQPNLYHVWWLTLENPIVVGHSYSCTLIHISDWNMQGTALQWVINFPLNLFLILTVPMNDRSPPPTSSCRQFDWLLMASVARSIGTSTQRSTADGVWRRGISSKWLLKNGENDGKWSHTMKICVFFDQFQTITHEDVCCHRCVQVLGTGTTPGFG